MVEIEGAVERISYYDEDNFFTVARLAIRGEDETLTAVGYFPSIEVGEVLKLKGNWVLHKDYGYQFKVDFYETLVPTTVREIENYLASGIIKGIGPVTAKKIVDMFKKNAIEIMETSPKQLLKVEGIGEKRLQTICESYEKQKDTREVMIFLQQYGIGPGLAAKVYKTYGDESIEILSQNPFRLADEVYGIGFRTADKIARKMGMKHDSLERLTAGLKFALQESVNEGHVYMPKDELLDNAAKLLEVDTGLLDQPLAALLEKGDVILDTSWEREDVYLAAFFVCEESVARQLFLLSSMVEKSFDITSQDIDRLEKSCGIRMAKKQRQALKMAATEGVLIITGGPGTGKTTVIKSLIEFFKQHKLSVALAAPTGRAAKRMNEATGQDAKTIHRLLEYKAYEEGGMVFGKSQDDMLEHDVIIIDEISMVDIVLMYHLLSAIKPGARLIMVGDADQLPSVGPGSVLRDMIKSELIPLVVLDEVFRQAKESMIVVNAHRINRGLYPYLNVKDKDFYFEQMLEPKEIENDILELASKRLPSYGNFDAIEDIQVLTPMKKGTVGVFNLNKKLQAILNPASSDKSELKHRFYTFRKGDKVMQVKNNYDKEVFNGDLGRIVEIDEDEGQVLVSFAEPDKDREIMYELQDMDELNLAYALSVHKSQGSEFPVVILPITTQHYIMLQRNLVYTAITRARKLLVMVGTKQAIRIAIRNNQAHIRYSRLAERIAQEFEGII